MRYHSVFTSIVVAALAVAALAPAPASAQQRQCTFNGDCDGLAVCSGGFCRAQCKTDADCVSEAACKPNPVPELTACFPKVRPTIAWQKLAAPERLATLVGGPAIYGVTRPTQIPGSGPQRFSRAFAPGRTVVWSNSAWRDVGPSMPIIAAKGSTVYGLNEGGQLQRLDGNAKVWSPVAGAPAFRTIVQAFDDLDASKVALPVGTSLTALYGIGTDNRLWLFKAGPDRFLTVGKESGSVISGYPKSYNGGSSKASALFLDLAGNDKLYVNDGAVKDVRWLPPLPAGTTLTSYAGLTPIDGWALTRDGKVLHHYLGSWEAVTAPTFVSLAVINSNGGSRTLVYGLDESGYVHYAFVDIGFGYYVRNGYQ